MEFILAMIVPSGISSISPVPNIGVGMRKLIFPLERLPSKSSWAMLHVDASLRPVMVYKLCTDPSGVTPSA